jgi:hypothetical protein
MAVTIIVGEGEAFEDALVNSKKLFSLLALAMREFLKFHVLYA